MSWLLIILVALGLLTAPETDAGERYTVRNYEGVRVGDLEKSRTGRLIVRDRKGRRVGTIEQRHGGRLDTRDRRGRRVESLLDR